MSVNRSRVTGLERAEVLARPHVVHDKRAGAESRNVGEVERLGQCGGVGIDDEDVGPLRRRARVELRGRRSCGSGGGGERSRGGADRSVLVEGE